MYTIRVVAGSACRSWFWIFLSPLGSGEALSQARAGNMWKLMRGIPALGGSGVKTRSIQFLK
jgi:hypothetical protein